MIVGVAVASVPKGVGVGASVAVGLGVGPGVKVIVGVGLGVGPSVGVGLGVNVGVAVGAGVTVIVGVGKGGYTKELTCKVAPATSCAVEPSGICLLTQIGHNSPSPAIFGLFSNVPIVTGVFAGARKN